MTEEQIERAASMWNRKMDTLHIASAMYLSEATIYKNLTAIRYRAKVRISRFEKACPMEAAL